MRNFFLFACMLLITAEFSFSKPALDLDLPPLSPKQVLAQKMIEARRLQGISVITDQHIARRLQSKVSNANKWRRMKIWFDLTDTFQQNPKRKAFYKKVYDIVGKWWESAVWINDSKEEYNKQIKIASNLTGKKAENKIPDMHITSGTYKDYDLLVKTNMAENDGGTLAFAGPVWRHPVTHRPITGEASVCWFGDKNFYEADDAVNAAVATIIHEFGHVMAFISFKEFHPHFTTYNTDIQKWMWTGDLVRKSAANFYGCKLSAMKGMALETFSKTEEGAHWLEATTDDELMSPVGGEEPEKVSPMMMAFIEDTNWYKSDYSVVENYMFQVQNPGHCDQKMKCPSHKACKLGTRDFVTSDYKGLGSCEKDDNGCPVEEKFSNRNVFRAAGWDLKYRNFGAVYSDRSIYVQGMFYRWASNGDDFKKVTQISAESWCRTKNHTEYWVSFKEFKYHEESFSHHGDVFVKCEKKGQKVEFNCHKDGTYCSYVMCYDPESLCTKTRTKLGNYGGNAPKCDETCMRNGRCQPGVFPENTPNETLRLHAKKQLARTWRRLSKAKHVEKKVGKTTPDLVLPTHTTQFSTKNQEDWLADARIHCGNISRTKKCGPRNGRCNRGYCNFKTMTCGESDSHFRYQLHEYSMDGRCMIYRVMRWLKRGDHKKAKKVLRLAGARRYEIIKFIKLSFILPSHSNAVLTRLKSDKDLNITHKMKLTPAGVKRHNRIVARICRNVSKEKGKCGPKIGRCFSGYCHKKNLTCKWDKDHQKNMHKDYSGRSVCRNALKKIADDKTGAEKKKFERLVKQAKQSIEFQKKILAKYENDKSAKKLAYTARTYYSGVPKALRNEVTRVESKKTLKKTRANVSPLMKEFFRKWRKGSWKCWCYDNYKVSTKCANIDENKRPDASYASEAEDENKKEA